MNTDLNLLELLGKNLQIHGLTVGNRADHEKMVRFIDEHGLNPVIDVRTELEQSPQAIANIAAGQHFGKLVVTLA
jgi:NADPH:quinone reductase-like Zn-dependent oxidoreductase